MIKMVAVRFIVFLVAGIVNKHCIGCRRPADEDAINGMGLGLGVQGVTVLLVMKVAEGEERKPSSRIWARAMDKHEGGY